MIVATLEKSGMDLSKDGGWQLDHPAHLDDRAMDYDIPALGSSNCEEIEAAKDPRPLLLSRVRDLLKAAGWLVTKHKRPCRRYIESKYRSPAGRSFRELPKVWKACGEILLADRFVLQQQDDGTGWNNISLFFSDLYETLMSMNKEYNELDISRSLIHQWNILHPFVTLIFIDKKIGMLRKGEIVKARRNLLIDKHEKRNVVLGLSCANNKAESRGSVLAMKHADVNVSKLALWQLSSPLSRPAESKARVFDDINERRDTVLGLRSGDVKVKKHAEGQLSGLLCPANSGVRVFDDTSERRDTVLGLKCGDLKANLVFGGQFPGLYSDFGPPSDSELTVFDGKVNAFLGPSPHEYFSQCSWHGTEGTVRLLSGTSFDTPTVNGNCLAETALGIQGCTELWYENNDRDPLLTPDAESDGAKILPGLLNDNLLLYSPSVYSHLEAPATVSPHSDGNANCLLSDNENVERKGHAVEDMQIVAWGSKNDIFVDPGTDKLTMPSGESCLNYHSSCFSTGCKPRNILLENADLVCSDNKSEVSTELLQQDELGRPVLRSTDIMEQPGNNGKESHQCSVTDVILKKRPRRKSKKISEIKSTELHLTQIIGQTSDKAEPVNVDISLSLSELDQIQEPSAAEARSERSCTSSFLSFPERQIGKKRLKYKKIHQNCNNIDKGRKRSRKCEIDDDDLLVSAILKKEVSPSPGRSMARVKGYKSRVRRLMKSKNGGCRLLPRQLGKGGKLSAEGKWSSLGARTVLSWLINSNVISPKDVIQFRDPKDKTLVKDGRVTKDGVICNCCNEMLSVTQFKIHAGLKLNSPCLDIFMESGEPLILCELQAWSSEYKTRKAAKLTHQADDNDQNDDSCGICGDVGELICCDNCPSTFHQACFLTEDLPEGNWYCAYCTCRICGGLVNSFSSDEQKCSQCEHKYHAACVKEKKLDPVASDAWFCGGSCQQVYLGLHSRIGLISQIADGYSWTLLRCIHDDQKVHSAQKFALKAECNSKLAVALSIVEECFASMVDPRTGIDMIPHVLYNWGSEFARLNFQGFYTMVLEKDDVLITAASIRLHGVEVAEMPLIATCSKYRRQGMCRRLMTALEELLISLKVEKLVIAAIPEVVETWTKGFGFEIVEKDEKQTLNKINLMVFPGTILLKKPLFQTRKSDTRTVAEPVGQDKVSTSTAQPAGTPEAADSIKGIKLMEEEEEEAAAKFVEKVWPEKLERDDDQRKIIDPVHRDDNNDVAGVFGPESAALDCSGSGVVGSEI